MPRFRRPPQQIQVPVPREKPVALGIADEVVEEGESLAQVSQRLLNIETHVAWLEHDRDVLIELVMAHLHLFDALEEPGPEERALASYSWHTLQHSLGIDQRRRARLRAERASWGQENSQDDRPRPLTAKPRYLEPN